MVGAPLSVLFSTVGLIREKDKKHAILGLILGGLLVVLLVAGPILGWFRCF